MSSVIPSSVNIGGTALGIVPIAAIGGLAYVMSRKGHGIGKLTKGFKAGQGLMGNAASGIGVKTMVNVADKLLLGGKMTSLGISFPVMGKTVGLNATDLVAFFLLNGLSLNKGALKRAASQLIPAKIAESQNWIDPPLVAMPNPQGNAQYSAAFVPAPSAVRTVN